MNETQYLNEALDLISDDGTLDAYNFLVANLNQLDKRSSQVYNFLYCLAATSDKPKEALEWLEEAIVTSGCWYRPEVFEDEDLDSIRTDDRFTKCFNLSNDRYLKALDLIKPVFTWDEKTAENLIIVLHGNQQNNKISEGYWSVLKDTTYQIEYLQSEEIDSYQLYRWEDEGNGPTQLLNAMTSVDKDKYKTIVLAGFSAGCNTILRGLSDTNLKCDKIVLQSPWIPCIEEDVDGIVTKLISKNIKVLIICGKEDEDCLAQCLMLESKAKEQGLKIEVNYIEGLGHDYHENFEDVVLKFCSSTV